MRRFGYPLHRALCYPVTILLITGIAFLFWRAQACWKGRKLPGPAGKRLGEE